MRLTWMTGLLIFSLALNAAVIGAVGYRHLNPPVDVSQLPCAVGDSHLYQRLGLNDGQLKEIEPLAHAFHTRMTDLRSEMQSKRDRLLYLLHREDNPDKLNSLRAQLAAAQEAIQTEVIAHITQIKTILTEKQQEQFFALMDQSMNCGAPSPGVVNR